MKMNACHNLPRPAPHKPIVVQDGWIMVGQPGTPSFSRMPRMVTVPFAMTSQCQYTLQTPDPKCNGCEHQHKST